MIIIIISANYVGTNTSHREGYKMASVIQCCLRKFNENLIDAVVAFIDARAMCPVSVDSCALHGLP